MLPDSHLTSSAEAAPPPLTPGSKLLAPLWHTAILLLVLLGASLNGARGLHPLAQHSKIPQYLWGITWELLVLGFVWLGVRKRVKLRELIGGRWPTAEDFLMDVLIAAMFWAFAALVLAAGAKLMHLDQAGRIDSMRRQLGFLAPRSHLELALWFVLSTTAGFCEEIIFRGYLQHQFARITRSMLVGAVMSALLFGAAHGYEGRARMVLIGVFGLLFGLLAWWRKSLRPGMMAHAWHDALSGAVLRMLK